MESCDYKVCGRDYRASLARNLNRRCSRLERARRSFRANKLGALAFGTPHRGDASLVCRGGRVSGSLPSTNKNPDNPQGVSGFLCRSGGIRITFLAFFS